MFGEAEDLVAGVGLGAGLGAGLRVDHVGIAVRSIEAARRVYEALGMTVGGVETIEQEQVRTAMVLLGDARMELIEPLEPTARDSILGKFLQKRGEGLHHIALFADALDVKFRQLKDKGVRLASDSVRVGAGGHRYFFVHPASAGGVLIEFVGNAVHIEAEDEARARGDAEADAARANTPRTGTGG